MTWIHRYRFRNYIKSSMWIVPLLSMFLALICGPILRKVDARFKWTFFNFGPEGARAIAGGLAASTFTFTVFVFSMLLIAVQIASAQLSPRIIATTVLNDRPAKLALGIFIFSYIFSLTVLGRIEKSVPQLPIMFSIIFSLVSIGVFLYLIDYVGKALRPISIAERVGAEGIKIIESVYPRLITEATDTQSETGDFQFEEPTRIIHHIRGSAVILALDVDGLTKAAQRAESLILLVPQVGDFIARGEPLFLVLHGGKSIDERVLHNSVALGPERTMEHDPAFPFRILVDIAAKALSPAVNDPTTAVLAIDQIHRLLRQVGMRYLGDGMIRDNMGQLRLIIRTPNWEDYLSLAISEIRLYGAGSLQVMRRLRAMIENLIEFLPQKRIAPLHKELNLIHRLVERVFADPEDRASADIADYQGLGGSRLDYIKKTYRFNKTS
jgi:uncharacterized membrane protein